MGKMEDVKKNLMSIKEKDLFFAQKVPNLIFLMGQTFHSDDEHHNGESVLQHTLEVVEDIESLIQDLKENDKTVLRLTAELHDIGKIYTFKVRENGKHTFYGHAKKSVTSFRNKYIKKYKNILIY